MTGEPVSAERALLMGLVHDVYPDHQLAQKTMEFCQRLSLKSYEALGMAKLAIELAVDLDRAQARNVERIANSTLFTGDEHKGMVRQYLDRQAAKRATRDGARPGRGTKLIL